MYLDDIELIYHETGIQSEPEEVFNLAVSGNDLIIHLNQEYAGELSQLEITDLSGRKILSKEFYLQTKNTFTLDLPAGMYICHVTNRNLNLSQKFIKN